VKNSISFRICFPIFSWIWYLYTFYQGLIRSCLFLGFSVAYAFFMAWIISTFLFFFVCVLYFFPFSYFLFAIFVCLQFSSVPCSFLFGQSVPLYYQWFLYSVGSKMWRNRRLSGSGRRTWLSYTSPARFSLFFQFYVISAYYLLFVHLSGCHPWKSMEFNSLIQSKLT
jgi:hypothetical protein